MSASAPGYWLLHLTIGGRVVRVSDVPVEVTEGADPGVYSGDLDPLEYTWGDAGDALTVDLGGLAPQDHLALLLGETALAVVYRYHPGAAPVAVFRGTVGSAAWSPEVDGLSLTLIPDSRTRALWPGDTLRVTPETCPITGSGSSYYPDQDALGMLYPVVFGRPGGAGGLFWDGTAVNVAASPGLLAEYGNGRAAYRLTKLIIAGHRVAATSVIVHDRSGGYSRYSPAFLRQSLTVYHTQDRLGQTVAYVSGADTDAAAGGIRLVPGNEYSIEWPNGGGITDSRGRVLSQAGDIVAYLLARSGVAVDEGGSARTLARLNRYSLAFALTERIDPVAWVASVLGELLGVRVLQGPAGLRVVHHGLDATAADAVGALEVGRNVDRAGGYRLGPTEDLANEVTVEYAPQEGRTGCLRVTVGASRSAVAALSVGRYGVHPREVQAPVVYESATARAIAQDLLVRHALPRLRVTVDGGAELERYAPGDVVLLTDSAAGLTAEPAVIGLPTWRASGVSLPLTLTRSTVAGR